MSKLIEVLGTPSEEDERVHLDDCERMLRADSQSGSCCVRQGKPECEWKEWHHKLSSLRPVRLVLPRFDKVHRLEVVQRGWSQHRSYQLENFPAMLEERC